MKNLSKIELIALVQRIMDADGTEEELDQMLDDLQGNLIHPGVSDLIYYPKNGESTAEEVVEEALAYKPIILGP